MLETLFLYGVLKMKLNFVEKHNEIKGKVL